SKRRCPTALRRERSRSSSKDSLCSLDTQSLRAGFQWLPHCDSQRVPGKREPDTILRTNGRESPELYSRAEFLTRFVRSRPLCNTGIDDPQSHPGSAHIAREVRAAVCPAARTWI